MIKMVKQKSIKYGNSSKLRIGIFSITSCQGCQWLILDLSDNLLYLMDKLDIINFPLLKEKNEEGPFDIAIIEGCITSDAEEEEVKRIRNQSKYLIAFGTCATYGGIPSITHFLDIDEVRKEVYNDPNAVKSISAKGIGDVVNVDYYLRGCPIDKDEFVSLLKDLLVGKKPRQPEFPVCVECKQKENPCLLLKGKPCLGPVTYAGCGAVCPSDNIACIGCRGPIKNANVEAAINIFKKNNISVLDIVRTFRTFAGTSKLYSKIASSPNEGQVK